MKNRYEVVGEEVRIHIKRKNGQQFVTLISIEDLPKLLDWENSWCIADRTGHRGGYYAYSRIPGVYPQDNITLHRLIIDAPPKVLVDHINGDTLDNRRENLRLVTDKQNNQNRHRVNRNSSTGVRGVCWHGQQQKWRAYLMIDYKQKHVGVFDTIPEAEAAIKKARARLMTHSPECELKEAA